MENIFWSTENTFQSKKNLAWFPGKCFPFILGGKHFPKVVKILGFVCFPETGFRKTTFQTFLCLFAIRKVG